MSLFAAFETQQGPESKSRQYDEQTLIGKGLLRLSYFVESRYVTRSFKNHLKSIGIFDPKYRRDDDRQQVYLHRPPIRRYSDTISNRKFKFQYILEHGGLKGLKDQPRKLVAQEPLHMGTVCRSRGRFFPNPSLTRSQRSLCFSRPVQWAKKVLKKTVKKLRASRVKAEKELGGHGPSQPPTNPVGLPFWEGSAQARVVLLSKDDEYPHLLGGQTFPSKRELATRWPDGNFRFFVHRVDDQMYPTEYVE